VPPLVSQLYLPVLRVSILIRNCHSLVLTVTLNTISPRKCCAYINALRVLHKVTKHSPPHLRMLVRFRAHVSTIELEMLPLAALTLAA